MREVQGNLLTHWDHCIVIPINTQIKTLDGEEVAVMGAGLAKQFANKYPFLPRWLAERIQQDGTHVYTTGPFGTDDMYLACVPTKRDWRDQSDPVLIYDMVTELRMLTRAMGWQSVALPRLGCGLGGLSWPGQIKPMLEKVLDDRFVIVHPEGD